MVQAGIGTRREHALASLLALNGLRVSEALNAGIDDLGFERGHHILRIIRKGGKGAVVPMAPRTARAVQLYINERASGPIFLGTYGQRMDRHAADRTPRKASRDPQTDQPPQPASQLHHRRSRCRRTTARRPRRCQSHSDPRTTMRYDRARHSFDRHATYVVATFIAAASG